MKKIYKSSVSKSTYLMFFLIVVVMILPLLLGEISVEDFRDSEILIYLGITALIIALFAWICFGTYYKIENGFLYHRSGPFFGKMKISSIRKIKYHSGWIVPVTYRPATDTKGIVITYNKFDEVYFSPKELETFINELKSINPEIEFVNFKKS